jgi:16S rRNA C967 or C1407 C5-methylase (RsmB/RsmF family)
MQEFDISLEILNSILDDKVSFADALKEKFQKDVAVRPLRPFVAGLVGCELRHHLLFTYLIDEIEKNVPEGEAKLEENERRFLALTMGNDFFYRHIEADTANEAFKAMLSDQAKYDRFASFLAKSSTTSDIIPESISRSSEQYLSLRYNTPFWTIKIWKHFGYGALYKTLRKFARPENNYLRVRTSLISVEEVLKNPDFVATSVQGILLYQGKAPLRKLDIYREGKVFLERPLTKTVFEEHKVAEPSEILLYNGTGDSSLEKELIETYGGAIGLNLGTPDVEKKMDVSKMIKDLGLHNVNFYSAEPLSMEAAISKKQDVVFCVPESTNFDRVRSTPDFLLNFDKGKMDGILENETNALYGCAKFVEVNGVLVYMVYTISKKEGPSKVYSFLRDHSDFKLESEKQHFPYEESDTALYVAVLRRVPSQIAIEGSGNPEIFLKSQEHSSVSAASAKN